MGLTLEPMPGPANDRAAQSLVPSAQPASAINHDVANPRSRITSDGHPRRRRLLSHGRVAKSFPGGTVGISGPAVPVAPRSGREPPKSTALDLTRVRFQSCRVCGASYFAILAIPGRPLTRGRPKGQLNPAGFSFAFAGCGKLLTLLFPMLFPMPLERARKPGGPPLFEPSFKVQRDSTHNQSSGFAVAAGSRPQRARSFKGPS